MPHSATTRRLILEAVVTCIDKYGIDKVTTRKIALEAGTNIASINYHFRSKDDLVDEALSMTIKHMLEDVFLAIDDNTQSFETAFTSVIFYLLDGNRRFPGVSRAHLYKAVIERERASISARAMVEVFERLLQRAIREYPRKSPGDLRLIMSQVLSSILFSMLSPGFFPLPRQYQPTRTKNTRTLAGFYVKQFKAML